MKEIFKIGSLILLALLLVACGPSAEEVAVTYIAQTAEAATNTPVPTASNTPTLTPSPTITPSPTVTPSLTPTPTIETPPQLSDYLENARFTFYDSFDYLELNDWKTQPCQTVSNGELEYACTNGFILRDATFGEGQGVLIEFKTIKQERDIYWGINYSNGNYGKDDWRNFGVSESQNKYLMHLLKAETWLGSDIYWIKPDVWYRLALAVGEDGRILVLSWERDNPAAQSWRYRNTLGQDWSDLEWSFWVNNDQTVTLYFDNFYQIEFDEIK